VVLSLWRWNVNKEWTKEQQADLFGVYVNGHGDGESEVLAVASRAVELHEAELLAKGGTLTAEQITMMRGSYRNVNFTADEFKALFEHLAAQGARVAALEAEVAHAQEGNLADIRRVDFEMTCSACGPTPHRFQPSHDAGRFWRCSECGAICHGPLVLEQSKCSVTNQQVCPSETKASATGHSDAYEKGAEAMRAACWEAVHRVSETLGLGPTEREMFKRAIEGATP